MSQKKKQNKKIRARYGSITLKELIAKGELPPFYHLRDLIDMKEEALNNKTDWWKKVSS